MVYLIFGKQAKELLDLFHFLINATVSLAVILYVVYTRELTSSSQKTAEAAVITAEANIRLVESMQSMLLEQWACELRDDVILLRGGDAISKLIHVEDKRIAEARYAAYLRNTTRRTLIFKPLNCGSRPVVLYNVKFQMNDTRSTKQREIAFDFQPPMVIKKDQTVEIPIAYNIEGELEIRVAEITYLDGEKKQSRWIANPYREPDRYELLESSAGNQANISWGEEVG